MFTETKSYIPTFIIGDTKVYGKNLEMVRSEFFEQNKKGSSRR